MAATDRSPDLTPGDASGITSGGESGLAESLLGVGSQSGGAGWGPLDSGQYVAPFIVPKDTVTRQLCAAVHLSASFANHVHGELVEPSHRAMAPNWHIDTLTLARHTEQALQRRTLRDFWLLVEFAVVVAVAELALASFLTGRLNILQLGALYLLGLLVAYAVAFAIVWWHYAAVHRSAVAVIGTPGVAAVEPPQLPPEVEEPLITASRANVILFSGGNPFVGSGQLLDRWNLTVDIGTGRLRPDGIREVPEPFDSLDLHQALLESLPESLSPRPVGGHRLYVVGGHATAVGGLFRSGPVEDDAAAAIRFRRPVVTIADDVIKKYLRDPGPSARPYSYFELSGWDGQVIVTLFIRIVVRAPILFVEMSVCALRPLRDEFGDVGTIPLGPGAHRLPVLRSVLPMTFPLLLRSPARAIESYRGGRAEVKARKDLEITLARRGDVNFSAGASLREEVSRGDNPNHFGYIDEEMYYRMFNRRSLDCLRDYLQARRVDLTDFEKQQNVIAEKTTAKAQAIYGAPGDDGGD